MSDETLTDPVLGVLTRRSRLEWVGRAWFTPKHEVKVVFDQFHDHEAALGQMPAVRELYALMQRREWDFRLAAAAELAADPDWSRHGAPPPTPLELARRMRLVGVTLFGDRSGHLTYRGPPPYHQLDIEVGVGPDGEFDTVDLFTPDDVEEP